MRDVESRLRTLLRLVGCLGVLSAPLPLLAQNYDNPSLGQEPVVSHPQDYKPLGIRAGTFMLHPGVELAGEWTDNAFYSFEDELDDFIWHLRPYITAQSAWSRHSFSLRLAADIGRYSDYDFRDYEDYFVNLAGTVDVKTRSSFSYNADWMQLHEDLNVRSAEQGVEPTVYTLTGVGAGYDHTFNRLSVGLDYDHRMLDYDDALRADGTIIDNQDRDRTEDTLGLRVSYLFRTDMQAFVGANWHQVDFDQEFDRNGIARSSDGWSMNAGLSMSFTGVLTGDVFASYHDRQFDDPTLPDVNGWALGAGLTWYPTLLTTVRGSIASNVQDTTNEYASGYLGTLYSLRVDHELLRNLQLSGRLSYRDNDYTLVPGAPPDARAYDRVFGAGVGATWFINRSLRLSASYDYSDLSTNVPNDGFKVNRVWLVLGYEK